MASDAQPEAIGVQRFTGHTRRRMESGHEEERGSQLEAQHRLLSFPMLCAILIVFLQRLPSDVGANHATVSAAFRERQPTPRHRFGPAPGLTGRNRETSSPVTRPFQKSMVK